MLSAIEEDTTAIATRGRSGACRVAAVRVSRGPPRAKGSVERGGEVGGEDLI